MNTKNKTPAQAPRPDTIRLDVHAHCIPLRGKADVEGLAGIACKDTGVLEVDGATMDTRALYDTRALMDWMDAQKVQHAWISIPPTLYRHQLDEDAARQWTTTLNRKMQAVAAQSPQRLSALLHLPMQHPALAAELAGEACAQGTARFAMAAGSAAHTVTLSDADYEPLWSALNQSGAFLFLHPSRGCDPRLDRFHLHNLLGGPSETALAAAHLAMSGVLERHPDIQFCLAHGGGATSAVAGRLERGRLTGRSGKDAPGTDLRQAMRRFCVDCITHDADALRLVAQVHGEDKVLFGSDWPFAMGLSLPHTQLADVDAALLQRIFSDNAARFALSAAKGS